MHQWSQTWEKSLTGIFAMATLRLGWIDEEACSWLLCTDTARCDQRLGQIRARITSCLSRASRYSADVPSIKRVNMHHWSETSVYQLTSLLWQFEVAVLGLLPNHVAENLGHRLQCGFSDLITSSWLPAKVDTRDDDPIELVVCGNSDYGIVVGATNEAIVFLT